MAMDLLAIIDNEVDINPYSIRSQAKCIVCGSVVLCSRRPFYWSINFEGSCCGKHYIIKPLTFQVLCHDEY